LCHDHREELFVSEQQPGSGQEARSVRLIFSYDGDDVRLESRQPVEMRAPRSDPVEGYADQTGFWTEVRDAQGSVLHRQVMHDPVRRDAEVFSPDPERSIARVPIERPHGVFSVVVPLVPGADHVALMGVPAAGAAAFAPGVVELHRVSLTGEESS
jgi:hypothetical protein